jgi:hypothetical protein
LANNGLFVAGSVVTDVTIVAVVFGMDASPEGWRKMRGVNRGIFEDRCLAACLLQVYMIVGVFV